ncbi:alpha/beta fold hydrolase [Caballeronia glebae]|jgi:3-oxoadipate enol-lactonase|uniref:alpha/beta fold hydrolase n=1 Tax=Caballeronia glebae TaxID=1777143 RepID=UPI0038BC1B93
MPVDAMELHCRIRGTGRDMVLLHPAGLDHAAMDALAVLAARTHRVVSMDLRGHGASPDARPGASIDEFADDVHATMARHCEGPAVVLGVSLGGMIAQALAWRHPESVSALVLCACTATFPEEVRDILRERGRVAERDGMSAVIEPTLDRWFTQGGRHGPFADHARERLMSDRVSNWSATWQAIAMHDMLPKLDALTAPTLVVAGESDAATPLAATRQLADAIPGARWLALQNAPHMMQMEDSAALHAAVMHFLADATGDERTASAEASS